MIDFQVAFDKLAQFQSSKEIATFFVREGVRGVRRTASHCPISNWLKDQTGLEHIGTCQEWIVKDCTVPLDRSDNYQVNTTEAMYDFINDFDSGWYPKLERGMSYFD